MSNLTPLSLTVDQKSYNFKFMRAIRFHSEMLTKITEKIPENSHIIDLGCGPGLLAERLVDHVDCYLGLGDKSPFTLQHFSKYLYIHSWSLDVFYR